jgi:hypothetical protein
MEPDAIRRFRLHHSTKKLQHRRRFTNLVRAPITPTTIVIIIRIIITHTGLP